MDFSYADVDNPEIFPPDRIWVWWDGSGEYMDSTHVEEEAVHWRDGGGFVVEYNLKLIPD